MKLFPLLALTVAAFVSCERHDWSETQKLHQHHGASHGDHAEHAAHGDAHADHGHEKKAEHGH